MQCQRKQCLVNIQSEHELNSLRQLLRKNKSRLTVSADQLSVGGKWKMWSFYLLPFPSNHSHSHSHETSLAIPIPMGIP